MFNLNTKIGILLYSLLHFLVDGVCSLVIWARLYQGASIQSDILFIIYNVLAFCTQPLFGILVDKYKNKEKLFLASSIILLILGVVFSFEYISSAILLGIGNSIFHIVGGKYVICKTDNDIVSLGVFVAPGALGLVIGRYFISLAIWIVFISLLVILTIFLLLSKIEVPERKKKQINASASLFFTLVFMIIFVVLFRSFVGGANIFTFEKNLTILLIMGIVTMLGKMLGGILSKYIGMNISIIVTMTVSLICFIFFNQNVYLSLLAILLFNCSMPMTLCLMNELFPKHEGFAFGILAAFLMPGYLLSTLDYSEIGLKALIATFCILSIVLVVISNITIKKRGDFIWKY